MPEEFTGAKLRAYSQALMAQKMAPVVIRFRMPRRELDIATRPVAAPTRISVPTRHGTVRCLVFMPHLDAPLASRDSGPPVNLQIHGGAFMIRAPWQDNHINRYIASDVGAVVVSPDYAVAPQARYPVAEEQCFDIARWLVENGPARGWDASRLAVGGTSAGGKLAINIVQQARSAGAFSLRAITLGCSVVDLTGIKRTSPLDKPYITPQMQQVASAPTSRRQAVGESPSHRRAATPRSPRVCLRP
jgi:acetyl esterase